MTYFVIPARKGSKGFPGKNRKLLDYTLQTIPKRLLSSVIITTDDEYILENSPKECTKIKRSDKLSNDTASTKDVLIDVAQQRDLYDDDIIVLLYLTYPGRTWDDIGKILYNFILTGVESLLCKKDVATHPYLCIYENGKQVVKHNLCRRQDYPTVYEISHFVGVFRVSELKKLNKNLYNKHTSFYKINDVVDVDYEKDLLKL